VKPSTIAPAEPLLATQSIDGEPVGDYGEDGTDWDPGAGTSSGDGNDQWKQPVRCATTADVTIATGLNAGDTIDGVTLAAGDRVLVKDQADAAENGIYVVGATPERAPDMDADGEVLGAVVYVIDGGQAGTAWACDLIVAPAIDTDDITFVAFGGGAPAGTGLPWFVVTDYGATGDGTTDDTSAIQSTIDAAEAAGGGVVYFPAGVYVVGGALADTSRSNSQLVLPTRHTDNEEQLTIHLLGEMPPAGIPAVVGTIVDPDLGAVIKGTLNTGSGTSPSLLGGWGPSGSFENFTMVRVKLENLTIRLPSNPVLTALNLSHVEVVDLDNVIVDCGEYTVQSLTEPTTSTSYGIRTPGINNGASTRLGTVNVIGYYTGIEVGEHTVGEMVSLWGCKRSLVFVAAYHASHFDRLMSVHCERGLVFTGGAHYFTIDQYNVEHAASGWWVTDYDIDDASNYGYGHGAWKVTLAGSGHDSTWTVNGGSNQHWIEIGDNPYAGATFATPAIVLGISAAAGSAGTVIRSNSTIAAFDATAPVTQAFGDSAATGSVAYAARRDHRHGMPASSGGGIGPLLIEDTPTGSPLVFADLLQNEEGTDLLYADAP
jgi:hypothetical protein